MKSISLFLILLPLTVLFAQDCDELFISEYVEGAGSNKAIELYNPSTVPVSLDRYSIRIYFNGATDSSGSVKMIQFRGILPPSDVYVLADDNIDTSIYSASSIDTFYSAGFLFNGDDAVALFRDSVLLDLIGEIGVDPDHSSPTDTGFALEGGSTLDHTLIRKPKVRAPLKNWSAGSTDWYVLPKDSASSLGGHTNCCFTDLTLELSASAAAHDQDNGTASATVSGGEEPYTYLWSNGFLNAYIQNLAGGLYHLTLTDQLGCSLKDSIVVEKRTNLNEPENYANVIFSVTDRSVLVQLQGVGELKLSVYDLLGKHYLSSGLSGPGNLRLDVGKFSAGVYLIKFKLGDRVQVRKLILK